MHDYADLRRTLGRPVSQTLDAPIMLFDFWELSEIFVALFLILVLGVLFYEWFLLCASLAVTLIGSLTFGATSTRGWHFTTLPPLRNAAPRTHQPRRRAPDVGLRST